MAQRTPTNELVRIDGASWLLLQESGFLFLVILVAVIIIGFQIITSFALRPPILDLVGAGSDEAPIANSTGPNHGHNVPFVWSGGTLLLDVALLGRVELPPTQQWRQSCGAKVLVGDEELASVIRGDVVDSGSWVSHGLHLVTGVDGVNCLLLPWVIHAHHVGEARQHHSPGPFPFRGDKPCAGAGLGPLHTVDEPEHLPLHEAHYGQRRLTSGQQELTAIDNARSDAVDRTQRARQLLVGVRLHVPQQQHGFSCSRDEHGAIAAEEQGHQRCMVPVLSEEVRVVDGVAPENAELTTAATDGDTLAGWIGHHGLHDEWGLDGGRHTAVLGAEGNQSEPLGTQLRQCNHARVGTNAEDAVLYRGSIEELGGRPVIDVDAVAADVGEED